MKRLVLASASPARRRLLDAVGIAVEVDPSNADEQLPPETAVTDGVVLLAARKAAVVAERRGASGNRTEPGELILGCDSLLELDGATVGKPEGPADAVERWRSMRGRTAVLHTGHCLIDATTAEQVTGLASTTVRFADVSDAEVDAYVATGEPLGVAGAFTIDGRAALFIEGLDGDHTNVIGLSMPLLRTMLARLGVEVVDLWR